jgi:recombination protein RecA
VVRPGCAPTGLPAAGTGLPSLDGLLGGGFPRGRISEVVGPRGSGRTSVLLGSLARATGSGALAALVDVTDRLDPASARAARVELSQLLWIRCGGDIRMAIQAADVIVRGGGFDLVVVDLGELPPWRRARVPAAAFVRLQRGVEGTPTALVLAGSGRVAGSMAAMAVTLSRARPRWHPGGPGLLGELATEARLVRSRDRAPGASVALAWSA